MDHLKSIILSIYRLNFVGGDKTVCRYLRLKFEEWLEDFRVIDHEVLSRINKKKREEPEAWR